MAPSYSISSAKNLKILSTLFRSRDNHLPYDRRLSFRSTSYGKFSFYPITDRRVRNQSTSCRYLAIKGFGLNQVLLYLLQQELLNFSLLFSAKWKQKFNPTKTLK